MENLDNENIGDSIERMQQATDLLKSADSLRRDLQNYVEEEITGLKIKDDHTGKERNMTGREVHNRITVLTGELEDWHGYNEAKHQQVEELKIILKKVKEWLAEK